MAKFITQLRHGTTSDWQKSSVIPAKNELVVEYRTDGSRKFKLGDGASSFMNLDYIDGDIERAVDVINARVSNLIVPPSGAISCDDEVEDIRVGYDGTTFDKAGDAVRAVGDDVHNLRKSLQQFINGDAVDGLLYEDNLLYLTADGVIVSDPVEIKGGSGGGGGTNDSSTKVRIKNDNGVSAISAATGSPVVLRFTFTSIEDDIPTGDYTCSISVDGKVVRTTTLSQTAQSIDVAQYLEPGTNTVRISCTDIYGNSRSLAYTCTVVDLSLVSSFNSSIPFDSNITFKYIPMGDIEKVVYFFVDGKEIAHQTITSSGRQTTQVIPLQSHGSHKLEVYATAVLNDQTIKSNTLVYDFMCIQAGRDEPLIASAYTVTETKQGNILSIPYVVYDPLKTEADIQLIITQVVNGVETHYDTTPLTVDRTQHYWNVRRYPTGTVKFTIAYPTDKYPNKKVTHTVLVEASDLSVEPITDSLALHLSAVGRSNDEKQPASWTYGDVTTSFRDFNWETNGWVEDDDKDTCLRLNGDARIDIGYKLFGRDFREMGKTIELEFAIRDVNDRDAVVIDCTDGDVSLQVTADTATLSGSGAKVNCTYRENERIRVGFTVGMGNNGTRFVSTYIDGILSNITQYPSTGNFEQKTKRNISIGSSLCGIDLYTIRVYDNELAPNEMVQNYIADATIPSVKQELFEDNDIYDDNNSSKVSYNKIKSKVPVVTFVGKMPTYKGDKKKNSVRMIFEHPTHPELNFNEILKEIDVQGTSSQFYVRKNWKTKHNDAHQHMVDQLATKVFCLKVDYAEATGTHNTQVANFAETLYSEKIPPQATEPRVRTTIAGFPCVIFEKETEDSEPVFSSKANFNFDKGSENAFGFTDAYDTECWEFCNNTSNSCNFLGPVPANWKDDFEPRYCGMKTTITNDDGEEETVGVWDRIEELREKKDALQALEPKQDLTTVEQEELDRLNASAIARFKVMHDWVLSTATVAPVQTTDEEGNAVLGGVVDIDFSNPTKLDTPVMYSGVSYEYDTKEYRLAKFEHEFENYFNMHYSTVYYVFTFFALMTDQRAKNMFLTYWKNGTRGQWYPYLYDNDTSFGINNEGARVFDYYHEDTDKLGTANVYNGQNSVLWNNFRQCFPQKIKDMYSKLRSDDKITYEGLVDQFITKGAEQWSASIYNEDAEYKYITMARPELNEKVSTSNLYQVKGSAEHHFKYFVENRIMYCDSKWNCGDYPTDRIFLRIYTPQVAGGNSPTYTSTKDESGEITVTSNWMIDGEDTGIAVQFDAANAIIAPEIRESGSDRFWCLNGQVTTFKVTGDPLVVKPDPSITVTTFSSMYPGVKYKANGTFQSQRVMAGGSVKFSPPKQEDGSDEIFNDTETAIYGASEISSLGDLSPLYCGVIDVSECTKLTDLTIGSSLEGYKNDNFRELSIGSNKLLTKLDVTNCTGLGLDHGNGTPQETLSVANCPNIEEVYASGTHIKTIELPESGYLRILHAPETLTSLTIKNQLYIELENAAKNVKGLKIQDWTNITQLYIDNCPKLDTVAILNKCKDADGNWTVERIRLTNVHWDLDDITFLQSLYNVAGRDQNEMNTEHAYLIGTCHIKKLTGAQMAEINAAYPYLDITFDELDAELTFLDLDGNLIVAEGFTNPQTIHAFDNIGGTGVCPILTELYPVPVRQADAQYTYEWGGWSRFRDDLPEADALINIRGDRTVYIAFNKTVKTYPVDFYNEDMLLVTVTAPYGSAAVYPYGEPQKLGTDNPELYEFRGWAPSPDPVHGPMKVYAQFQVDDDTWHILGLNDIKYTVNSNTKTLSITDYDAVEPVVRVPSTFGASGAEYTVTSIKGFNTTPIELIDLPDTLAEFGDNAFKDCRSLSNMEVPVNVTKIGNAAFANCTNLDNVQYDASNASVTCTSVTQGPFNGCVSDKGFIATIGKNVLVIPASLFAQGAYKENTLTNVAFESGSSCTTIGSYAFSRTSLEDLRLPSSVRTIENHAFLENNYITSLELPEGVQTLGDSSFSGWRQLQMLKLPSTITSIGTGVFSDCPKLESISIDSGNRVYEVVDNCLIDKSRNLLVQGCMNSIIPSTVTAIQANAFQGCSKLTSVAIPSGVSLIPSYTFDDCTSLTDVVIPSTVTDIEMLAFYNCGQLQVELPDSVEYIRSHAFAYNAALENIQLPKNLKILADRVFRYCRNLKSVTFRGTPSQIDAQALADCAALTTINVPWSQTDAVNTNAPWGATGATINYNYTGV